MQEPGKKGYFLQWQKMTEEILGNKYFSNGQTPSITNGLVTTKMSAFMYMMYIIRKVASNQVTFVDFGSG